MCEQMFQLFFRYKQLSMVIDYRLSYMSQTNENSEMDAFKRKHDSLEVE